MKNKLLFKTIALMVFLTCALGASAATENFSKDGIYYQLTTYSDGRGVLTVQNNGSFNTYSGVVNIPDSVQEIEAYAFSNSSLDEVMLSRNTKVAEKAFSDRVNIIYR